MVVSASTDTSPLTPSNLSIMGSQTTMNTTESMTLKSNMLSITSLSPNFVLQLCFHSLPFDLNQYLIHHRLT